MSLPVWWWLADRQATIAIPDTKAPAVPNEPPANAPPVASEPPAESQPPRPRKKKR